MKALQTENRQLVLSDAAAEPTRQKGEVLVKVHYASLNPTDADIVAGALDLFMRLYGAKSPVRTGLEFSGVVLEGDGAFKPGTRVFGYTHLMKGPKTHQDIISIPKDYIAVMPDRLSFAKAAAFPLGAQTSLVALRDVAQLRSGQSVLIIGGSGGLGVFAIQIARNMGLQVTGMAGPAGQDVMSRLGAHALVNYRETALSEIDDQFDAVLDLSDTYSFGEIRHLLTPKGVFVPTDPTKHLTHFLTNPLRRQKVRWLLVDRGNRALLTELAQDVSEGALTVDHYIEMPFEDFQNAMDLLKETGRIGRIVLKL